ncbi:MAG: DNA-directed RNA polymerase subunit K, partial [Candidatus Pacearchaeota archaeon]
MKEEKFTKYETARILGARALQIAMDAPLLKDIPKEELEKINYEPMKIAEIEFESNVLPITVKKPMPKKKAVKIKKISEESQKTK